jgi:two-component system sensor histidine kinase PilS (NtrC family)
MPLTQIAEQREDWRLLRIYAGYRLALSLLLIGLFAIKTTDPLIGAQNPSLFLATALGYLITTVTASAYLLQWRRHITSSSFILLLLDILALTLMMHASGSINTQLSLLYLVTIAAGNILLTGRLGALIAALASIAILFEQFYFSLRNDENTSSLALAQSAILGISFFAVALFSQVIVRRMRQGEELAEQRAQDIINLQRLNEQIIRRMRTGIIALNPAHQILLSNEAAQQLLGLMAPILPMSRLRDTSLLLEAIFFAWQQNPLLRPIPFKNSPESPQINVRFARLTADASGDTVLLFLEDTTQLTQQAQHLKLASLGRLTASIAHEVRNPLGAISHATQLLAESELISGPDRRLLDIIEQHCRRMNTVIENVLTVSRRQPSAQQTLHLPEWLSAFNETHLSLHTGDAELQIKLKSHESTINVRFDPEQLHQVVSNLVMNGMRYSRQRTGLATIRLEAGWHGTSGLPHLDIIDNGADISTAQREHLFEPFYTTESTGTGLGLYLSREICEANQARLDYIPRDSIKKGDEHSLDLMGACFRITFSHPDRLS